LVKKSKNFGIAVDDGDTVVLPRKKFKSSVISYEYTR